MKSLSCSCPNNIWIFFPHDAQLKIEVSYLQLIFNIAPTPSKTWHSRTCSLSMTMTLLVQHCSSGYWSNIITNNRTEAPLRACSTDSCLCRNSEGRQNTTPPPPLSLPSSLSYDYVVAYIRIHRKRSTPKSPNSSCETKTFFSEKKGEGELNWHPLSFFFFFLRNNVAWLRRHTSG